MSSTAGNKKPAKLQAADLLAAVAPSAGSKFSPRLYNWLRKYHKRGDAPIVVRSSSMRQLYIGYFNDGEFHGSQLGSVLTHGPWSRIYCHLGSQEWKPVVTFWKNYRRLGRCYLDRKHKVFWWDPRWKYEGGEKKGRKRTCLWCGLVQKRVDKMVKIQVWE